VCAAEKDAARKLCAELGDRYHQALCDLDESEIYLELNLTEGGTELAQDAFAAFTDLGESYFKGGKRAEAKKQILAALEIAPGYERAQGLLLKLVEK
jgi:hypothetical protein